MKKKAVVYGIGRMYGQLKYAIEEKYEVVGYVDKYLSRKDGTLWKPEELLQKEFDCVLVTPCGKVVILQELIRLGIPKEKLIPYYGENKYIKIEDDKIRLEDDKIIVTDEKYRLELKTYSDDAVFHEVFIQRGYDIHLTDDYAVLDIGMNVGFVSVFYAMNESVKAVYGFEPFPQTYYQAVNNVKNWGGGAEKVHTFNIGLGNRNTEVAVNYDANKSECMSLVRNNAGESREKVQLKDAAEVLASIIKKEQEEGRKILCKMDCEGSEYDVFDSMDKQGLIDQVDVYLIEWHYRDDDSLVDCLTKYGYTVMKSYDYGAFGKIIAWK